MMQSADQIQPLLRASPWPGHNEASVASDERRRLPSPEENPWRNASYICAILQLMMTLLDLFMESGEVPAIHYAITTLQFCPALFLTLYQCVRIHGLCKFRKESSSPTLHGDFPIGRRPFFLLSIALVMQLYVVIVSGMYFNIHNDTDSHGMEWSVFAIVLLWSVINPATYTSVKKVSLQACDGRSKEKARMGPVAAAMSVFTKHFMKEKMLFVLAASSASGQAILTTYQGALINELTKLVTKAEIDPREIELKSVSLVGVWAAANFARLIFDLLSATMFSRLEVWLRGAVFEKALADAHNRESSSNTHTNNLPDDLVAEFGARYASDVQGVISLYGHLLRGVIVNVLLIITNFIFLVLFNWEIAVATICFLAMAVTSGPTDLAGNAAVSVQQISTNGLGMLGEGIRSNSDYATAESLCKKHEEEILIPLKKSLFSQMFYTSSVDTFINFFASFMTVIVVMTMVQSVYEGGMEASDFLGVYFVFKQLQKPAMKISGVLKSLIKKSANLDRLNKTIFEA